MSDLLLRLDPAVLEADLAIAANDLVADDGLETAVLLSLFTDRRAGAGDVLPPGETDRRGWWGDAFPVVEGDLIGSRLWLLTREKQRSAVLPRVEEYAREALAWLVEDRVASKVEVVASFPRAGWLALDVSVYRPLGDPTKYRFDRAWEAAQASASVLAEARRAASTTHIISGAGVFIEGSDGTAWLLSIEEVVDGPDGREARLTTTAAPGETAMDLVLNGSGGSRWRVTAITEEDGRILTTPDTRTVPVSDLFLTFTNGSRWSIGVTVTDTGDGALDPTEVL
jgi:phage gp46-like protein